MYADRGGTPTSGPPFDHYDAKPSTMYSKGDEILGKGKKVEGSGDRVVAAHRPAAAATHGNILPMIEGAPRPVQQKAQKVNQTTVFASGCVKYWGKGIQTFNTGVDKLNDEWDAAVADDFGLTKPTKPSTSGTPMPGNVRVHETYNTDLAAFNTQLSAKKAAKAKELRGRFTKLETKLDNLAQKIAGMLKKGPDEKSILTLFGAGALPLMATTVFPNVDFGKTNWRKALEAYGKQLPGGRLSSLTKAEIKALLEENPGLTQAVNWLLKQNGIELTAFERDLVKVQAAADVWTLKDGDGDISGATVRLRLINDTAHGVGRINEAGTLFIDSWLDAVGPEALTDLPDAHSASELKPIANAIMLRMNPDELETAASDESPAATIQTLLHTRVGVPADNGRLPGQPDDGLVEGLDRFNGWSKLLSASTAESGEWFSKELGHRAIQARQDLNGLRAGLVSELGYVPDQYKQLLEDDSASSDLLSLTARSQDGSSRLLLDKDDRQALLSMNWNDADGASQVITSGTDRDADDGSSIGLQRNAAKALMEDIAKNRDLYRGYTEHAGVLHEKISDAVVDMGISWGDTFLNPSEGVDDKQVDKWDVQLSDKSSDGFLEFIGRDDESDALRFQSGVRLQAQAELTKALQDGDPVDINNALSRAGRFDARMTEATHDALLVENVDDAVAAKVAEQRTVQAAHVANDLAQVGVSEVLGKVPGGGALSALSSIAAEKAIDEALDTDPSVHTYNARMTAHEKDEALQNNWEIRRGNLILNAAKQAEGPDGRPVATQGEVDDGPYTGVEEVIQRYRRTNGIEISPDRYDSGDKFYNPDDEARRVTDDEAKERVDEIRRRQLGESYPE